jgi:hypothetical protein
MKALSLIRIFLGLGALVVLAGTPAFGQSEIDPDHFEFTNAEPFSKPRTNARSEIGTQPSNSKFTLHHIVQSNGKYLSPGMCSIALDSDGKAGHETLIQRASDSHSKPVAAKELGDDAKNVVPATHLINSLAIAILGSCRLASPIRDEGNNAGPIVRVRIANVELLEHFLGHVNRFQQCGASSGSPARSADLSQTIGGNSCHHVSSAYLRRRFWYCPVLRS